MKKNKQRKTKVKKETDYVLKQWKRKKIKMTNPLPTRLTGCQTLKNHPVTHFWKRNQTLHPIERAPTKNNFCITQGQTKGNLFTLEQRQSSRRHWMHIATTKKDDPHIFTESQIEKYKIFPRCLGSIQWLAISTHVTPMKNIGRLLMTLWNHLISFPN